MESDEQIRILCRRLLRTEDPVEVQIISEELQKLIHARIERLRLKILLSVVVPPKSRVA